MSYQQWLRAKCLCPDRPGQGQGRIQSLRFGDPKACASCSPSGCQGPSSRHRPPGRDCLKRLGLDVPQSRCRACGKITYEWLEVVKYHGSRRQSSISKEAYHGSRKGVHPLSLQGQDQGERKEESLSPQEQLKRGWLSWITVNRFYQRGTAPVGAKNTWSTEQLRCPQSRRAGWKSPPPGLWASREGGVNSTESSQASLASALRATCSLLLPYSSAHSFKKMRIPWQPSG